jgi:hypothetical protein
MGKKAVARYRLGRIMLIIKYNILAYGVGQGIQ